VNRFPKPGIPTRKCSELSTQFAKCAVLLHMSKLHKYLHDARILRPQQPKHINAKQLWMQTTHTHTLTHTHTPIDNNYGLICLGFDFRQGQEIFCLRKPPRMTRGSIKPTIQWVPCSLPG
jgi:hypothetical protein